MKTTVIFRLTLFPAAVATVLFFAACSNNGTSTSAMHTVITGANLVSDTGFAGAKINPSLKNAWGMDFDLGGNVFIVSNQTGTILALDTSGNQTMAPVTVPARTAGSTGSPSGLVLNTTGAFKVPGIGTAARIITVTEDVLVAAWNSGATATIVDTADSGAVYKGVAIGSSGGKNFIYAANFREKRIDVYDTGFVRDTTKKFTDASIPTDFGPFNIALIDGKLYVAYAKPKAPDFKDDTAGPGNGYVAIFNTDGTLNKHLISQGALNSPWGMTKTGSGFGALSGDLLVGNFGNGRINRYDGNGNLKGPLIDSTGDTVSIDGLWAIKSPGLPTIIPLANTNIVLFTAGPADENHGLFGVLFFKRDSLSSGFGF
jgi:uncharacterized protein (TIGR03118 family)